MPLLMTGVWKRSRGSTKHLPGILEKISPLSDLMYLQEWYFCTQERQEIERKGHSACWTLRPVLGIGSLSIILFVRFLYGSVMDGRLYLPRRGLKAADRQILDLLHGFEER